MLYVYWAMLLPFCLRSDARLSLTKSIPREPYHLLPQKSFRRPAKVCLEKDSKPGSRPDQRQQIPYLRLLLWARIHDHFRFFAAAQLPSGDEGTARVVPVKRFQMPATSASFRVHSEADAELPEEPCNKSLHPPSSREAFSLAPRYDVTFKSVSRKSPPLSRTPENCISNWVVISKHPSVLETVQGCHLDLVSTPHQLSYPLTVPLNKENMALIDLEIQLMLEKEAIHVVPPGELQQGFVSSIFLVPKKGGGQRPVMNLRPLNQFIPYEHFKMEGIHMLKDLLRKGYFMVKIDLKDAYFTVPV